MACPATTLAERREEINRERREAFEYAAEVAARQRLEHLRVVRNEELVMLAEIKRERDAKPKAGHWFRKCASR